MRSIICDRCDARLDDKPWHIALENRRTPVGRLGLIEDAQQQLPGGREYHFCSLLCLGLWVEKLGPKGPTGPS